MRSGKTPLMKIGEVSKRTAIGIETIRFYEREKLIPLPKRTASGFRLYDADILKRLRFISRAKALGFSLKEIEELLQLRISPRTNCTKVHNQASAKIAEINKKIKTLQKFKNALTQLVKNCEEKTPTAPCPILNALEDDENED